MRPIPFNRHISPTNHAGAKNSLDPLMFTLHANGIGDALCALLPLAGVRKQHPTKEIHFYVKESNHPWINLFDHGIDKLYPMGQGAAVNLNAGYDVECATKGRVPRWKRYCANAGGVEPVVPQLRNRDELFEAGKEYRDVIALCPFSV